MPHIFIIEMLFSQNAKKTAEKEDRIIHYKAIGKKFGFKIDDLHSDLIRLLHLLFGTNRDA